MHQGPRGGGAIGDQVRAGGPQFSLRTFESLKVRNFRFYMSSSLAQMACMNMQMMANGWFMYHLSGSAALLGLTLLASAFPQLFFSPLGGIIADRVSKKAVLIGGLVASALLVLWIGLSTSLGVITWHYLVLSSFFQGTIFAFMMPSRQALVPELVGRENLMNAVGLNMVGMNVNRLGAPALAGFLIGGLGIASVYYLMTGLYLLGIVFMLPIRRAAGAPALARNQWSRRTVLGDLLNGMSYVRDNKDVRAVLILTLITVMFSMPYFSLLPVFAEDVLKVGPEGLGILMSVSGIGALAGSLAVASLKDKNRGAIYLWGVLITGVSLIAFSLSTVYVLAMATLLVVGLGQAVRMALSNTMLQAYTSDAYLGRVMSVMMMEWGLTSFGAFGIAVLAEIAGVQWAIGLSAACLVLTAAYYYAFSPRIRRLD